MKKILFPTLMLLIGLITLSFTPAKDGVLLRLKPSKGSTYTVNNKVSMMNMMEIQGQSMTSSQVTEIRQTLTIKDVNTKDVTIEEKVDALKLTVSQMGMVLTYDSEHPEKTSPMLAGQVDEIAEVLNKVFTNKYDVQGNLMENEEEKEDDGMQSGSAIIPLPDEEVSVGSVWNKSRTQTIGEINIKADMTYTVTKVSKKSIEISISGTISGDEDVSGSYEGTASINPETGLIIKSSVKMNASLSISEQGLTIPLTMNGTTTITVE